MLKTSTGTEIYVVPNNLTQFRVILTQCNNIPAGRCQPSFRCQLSIGSASLGARDCDAVPEPHTHLPFCLRMVHVKLNSTGSLGVRRGRRSQTTSSALTCCIASVCIYALTRGALLTETLMKACHYGECLDSSTGPLRAGTQLSLSWQDRC
jgi:hypothetical protein